MPDKTDSLYAENADHTEDIATRRAVRRRKSSMESVYQKL